MKKLIFLGLAVFALCVAATVPGAGNTNQVTNTEHVAPVPPFKNATMGATVTLNCINSESQNFYLDANDSFTLALSNVKPGGTYTLLIRKTISAPVLVTTTATGVNGTTSPISLTGSTNTFFVLHWTNRGGTNVIWRP